MPNLGYLRIRDRVKVFTNSPKLGRHHSASSITIIPAMSTTLGPYPTRPLTELPADIHLHDPKGISPGFLCPSLLRER